MKMSFFIYAPGEPTGGANEDEAKQEQANDARKQNEESLADESGMAGDLDGGGGTGSGIAGGKEKDKGIDTGPTGDKIDLHD